MYPKNIEKIFNDTLLLENFIRDQSILYYTDGKQILTDTEFDLLVGRLRELKPDSEVLTTGWGFKVDGNKVKHKYTHIGSLDKCKKFEDFPDRFLNKVIYLSPKLDGLSAVAYYRCGKLIKGVTRGNGEIGKDITDKLKLIIGNEIEDKKFTGAVRGELIISDKNWNELQNKYNDLIAPRNFAAGIINRKDLDEDIKYIDFVVYKIVGQENRPVWTNRKDILFWLKTNYRRYIPICFISPFNKTNWELNRDKFFDEFKQLGYGLDGIVLTQETAIYDEKNNSLNYSEVAFKFESEKASTRIKEIEWTLSRTGRYIPVAVVEPVELSGAIIQRCTCNNAKWVKDLGLGKGAEVVISRQNEVIPGILEVVEQSDESLPTSCPFCNEDLIWDGVDLKCLNRSCKSRDYFDLQQWCEVIGETDNFAWLLMKQYLDKFNITNLAELYFNKDNILDWFNKNDLSITDYKAYEFFMKLFVDKVDSEKALLALNIPRIGSKTVQLLAQDEELILTLFSKFMQELYSDINMNYTNEISKLLYLIKDASTNSIFENKSKFVNIGYLIKDDRIIFISRNKDNINYVAITGSLETMKRKDFEKFIKQYGYELTSSLKKCKYLITNDPNSNSTKNKEAQKYNIPLITEKEFLDLL